MVNYYIMGFQTILLLVVVGVLYKLYKDSKTKVEGLDMKLNQYISDSTKSQITLESEIKFTSERYSNLQNTLQNSNHLSNNVLTSVSTMQELLNELRNNQIAIDKSSNIKGSLGNMLLKQMLEDIYGENTEGKLWKTEYVMNDVGRPDGVVFFKDTVIPIDSKNIKDDYIKYLNSEINFKQLTQTIVQKVKDINKYVRPDLGTSNYAILFIPSEQLYYDVIVKNSDNVNVRNLRKEAMKNSVLICSPNTLYVELYRIMENIEMDRIHSKSKEMLDIYKNVEDTLNKNIEQLESWTTRFKNISSENDTMIRRTTGTIKKLKGLE